ncbi:serine/threonine-protein kinase [uncultured Parabacteroides sp.]|uniref:serine/threonine protein kinase n=2 Tax=uncultured Parabacteroides sp. TaxID=512312 RepID=UPI00272A62C9|nr:serine/threonine-protein kinase [uncultured Parabacteroides sp.]
MNLPNGHVLQNGKYRITHVIGQGGFGITYKGVWYTEVKGSLGTVQTEVPICIKEYFFKDYCYREAESFAVKVHSETGRVLFDKFKEKLIKEAKILSEVHHPHIVNVLEVFEENDTAYIAMEYISGCSLKYMMDREGVLPEAKVLRYVRQIGEALQFVHEKNILHLDIKPSNILIDSSGKARLIDFGVSKRYDIEQQETSTTMLTLSKGLASIEQYDNEGTQSFSPCPDIYSLGATMYNLLTGKIPTESILRATRPLQNPSELNKDISPKTEAAIIKAMQIIPADRYQTVAEMMAALDLPPEEEKFTNGLQNSDGQEEEDETTVIHQNDQLPQNEDDEDRTIVNSEEIISQPRKKKRKGVLISVVIAIFACIGSAVAFLVQGNKVSTKPDVTELINPVEEEKDSAQTLQETTIPEAKEESPLAGDQKTETVMARQPEKVTTPATVDEPRKQPETKQVPTEDKKITIQPPQPTAEEIDAEYTALIASGKEKMGKADFTNAKKDFTKAKETKLTEEVVRLLISCDEKEAAKLLADRKAQYEMKKTFGNFTIVRKKSTMLYGAIDSEANERIPCKYRNVGIAENGRAFERKDGLFDIYNADGVLINEGSTYY